MADIKASKVKQKKRGLGLYQQNILTKKVQLPYNVIGNNIAENILKKLSETISGKCIKEGYIKTNSIRLISYSAGVIVDKYVVFVVVFECLVCRPVEGMRFRAIVKNVTKAGVRCETKEEISPVVVFIARDHHFKSKEFSELKIGDEITVRVIGIRFELNDKYISVIAEHVIPRKSRKRPKIIIKKNA